MPCRVKCSVCGHVLIESKEFPRHNIYTGLSDWYTHLYYSVAGECPLCGHKLPTPEEYAGKMKVEVFAAEEVKT